MKVSKIVPAILFGFALMLAQTCSAHVNSSAILGAVSDSFGASVAGVKILAVQAASGLTRETVTNSQGNYVLDDMPIGLYSVSFSKAGFNVFVADRVLQNVGHTRTLNVELLVVGGTQQITVTQPLVEMDTASATVGAPVEQAQVQDLPLNGRNWANLTALVPGAIDNGGGDQRTIRFAGHGLDDNNLTLDGVDATAIYNQEQREYMRLNIPLDSVSQFQVQSQNFGADVEGGAAGGQVAVVSPSGTNAFHGDLFNYFRNSALEARTPFNGSSPNGFLLNQFGGGTGGPIVKNKTFFYANYEGLRQRLDGTQIGTVPSPAFLAQAAISSPILTPVLSAYPTGTSPTSNPNVWNYIALGRQVDNEDSGLIRIDQHFSDRTTAFVRFNSDEAVEQTPAGNLNVKTAFDTKFNNGVVDLVHVFSANLTNDVKFGANQDQYHSASLSPLGFGVNVTGAFSPIAGASTTDNPSKTFSFLDDLAWSRGKHTLKLGFEIRRIFINQGTSQSGSLTYTSASKFLANQIGSASYTSILPLVRQRKNQYWGYVQDEWKVTRNLTISAGIRYNYFNALHAVNNQDDPFDFGTCGGYCPRNYSFFKPRTDDIDPRLAIAWSRGDTVIRAGGGIYHTDGQEDDQNLPISNLTSRYAFTNTSFPTLSYPLTPFLNFAQNGGLGVVSPRDLDRNRKDDYVAAWTFSVQQKLPFNIVGTATYLGNKATDVLTTTYVNLVDPVSGKRPYLAFGPVSWRGDVGNATFEALQFNGRRAFQNGLLLTANYMWSHSINDGSIGGGESDTPQNSFCRACDKGNSDNDVRHVFNLSTVYSLPFGSGKHYLGNSGLARALLGGWEISAIGTAQSGLPVNITISRNNSAVPGLDALSSTRPNYNAGVSLTPAGGSTPQNWINAAAFSVPAPQTFGNLGRNAFRAPGIGQLDLGLSKYVSLTERLNIRLRADLFNATNSAQYGAPNAVVFGSNFGVITSTISNYATGRGTPREFQLSAKIVF